MTPDHQSKSSLSSAEQKVRRALLGSLGLLAVLGVIVGIALLWKNTQQATPEAVVEMTSPVPITPVAPVLTIPEIPFTEITSEAGIAFIHVNGAYGERLMPETIGSGAAFFDYDNDDDQDLLLINFGYWPEHVGNQPTRHALYANDGQGGFTDVTESAGLAINDYGMGVAVGDFDADGWTDLYLTNLGKNRLLRNQQGIFSDVTAEVGVAGEAQDWSSSAAFIDYDRDGDLDLFVANYVKWSRKDDLEIDFRLTGLGRAYGAPNHFIGAHNRLYQNQGDGQFLAVSTDAGILIDEGNSGRPAGKGLGVSPVDYDGDGWIDLIIANDTVRNFLYHNLGNGRFEEIGAFEGIAFDRNGKATGAMGIDSAHFRNDRELGVSIGNFANEMSSLFVTTDGQPPFADEAVLEGLGPDTRQALTFGLFFFDADLDGRLDLLQANGHLEHEINKVQPSQHYAQPAQLFWNCGDDCRQRYQLVSQCGDLLQPMVGRGATYADIDNDGDLDLLITQNGRAARLFRNDQQTGNHWLRIRLIGKEKNPQAIGARIELTSNNVKQTRTLIPTRSFMSQVELTATFGLGSSEQVDRMLVTWPDGAVQEVKINKVDELLTIRQR